MNSISDLAVAAYRRQREAHPRLSWERSALAALLNIEDGHSMAWRALFYEAVMAAWLAEIEGVPGYDIARELEVAEPQVAGSAQ